MALLISITLIVAVSIGLGLLLTAFCWKLIMLGLFKKPAMRNQAQAEAIVLNLQPTGLFINKLPQVKMQMQVQPEKGRNFIVEIQQLLQPSELELIREGSRIMVQYDTTNHKLVSLLKSAWKL